MCFVETKLISKRANFNSQKYIEGISNVITDIGSVAAISNCITNSVTDIANHIIIFFGGGGEGIQYAIWIIIVTI